MRPEIGHYKQDLAAVIIYDLCNCGTTDPIPDVADLGPVQNLLLALT